MRGKFTMYKDQYNNIFYASTLKELKGQVKGKTQKIYSTDKQGNTFSVGYVIGNHWLYAFTPFRKKVFQLTGKIL
jgi:hypothetical protein